MIDGLLGTVGTVIDKIWPDKDEANKAKLKLMELQQAGGLAELDAIVELSKGQMEINKQEAAHKSMFVAGARPFILWVGGVALAWTGIMHPLLTWVWAFADISGTPPPVIESGALTAIVTGLLGIGGMRTVDKMKGTVTNAIRQK